MHLINILCNWALATRVVKKHYQKDLKCCSCSVPEEENKELVVFQTHTVTDPRAVMIHAHHTTFTDWAMVRARDLYKVTRFAKAKIRETFKLTLFFLSVIIQILLWTPLFDFAKVFLSYQFKLGLMMLFGYLYHLIILEISLQYVNWTL